MTGLSDSIKNSKDHFIKTSKISSINKVLVLFGFNHGQHKEYIIRRENDSYRFDAYSFFTKSGEKRLLCLWVDHSFNIKDSALFFTPISNLQDLRTFDDVPDVEMVKQRLMEISGGKKIELLLRHKF